MTLLVTQVFGTKCGDFVLRHDEFASTRHYSAIVPFDNHNYLKHCLYFPYVQHGTAQHTFACAGCVKADDAYSG